MAFDPDILVRDNIRKLNPYSTARHEFTGMASVFLDANENAFGSPLSQNSNVEELDPSMQFNRYPDPMQMELKEKISRIKGVAAEQIFLGNGSDEAIDLLFRIFCEPGRDNVLLFPPTYGMYEVCAGINNVPVRKIPLTASYQLDLPAIETGIDPHTKLIFICSPNNPTGNSIYREDIEVLLNNFDGLVVIDEAYINYSRQRSFIPELSEYPNLVILHTLSKAWGLAALRIGMAFASEKIIGYMNKVKYPYNISAASQQIVLDALNNIETVNAWTKRVTEQKMILAERLAKLPDTETVHPSDANFLLVKIRSARAIYEYLADRGIIVRDRSNVILCEDCLRITIGTPIENEILMKALSEYKSQNA